MPMRSSYRPVNGKTALLNKRTRPITLQRRFQAKERVQLLCNGVSKQKNASNYFATALLRRALFQNDGLTGKYVESGRSQLAASKGVYDGGLIDKSSTSRMNKVTL